MKFIKYINNMNKSERVCFFAKISTTENYIRRAISGNVSLGAKRCVQIEKATNGAVARKDLRQDWIEIWPELRLETMPQKEILEQFKKYGFTDRFGHPLENCADFLALVVLAAKQ